MHKMSQKMMWSIAGAVLIVAAIVLVMVMKKGYVDMSPYPTGQQSANPTPAPASATAANISYNEALKKYGTNRIQFDATCQTIPNNVTYKAGTQVMFDNRAGVKRTINFNGTNHTIAAYGFKVISMTAAKYPATIGVDCDASRNVSTILIQK